MLIGEDATPGLANTGVWLIRSTREARALLSLWDRAPLLNQSLVNSPLYDEDGFNTLVLPAHRDHVLLPSRKELNWVTGPVVHHHYGGDQANKTRLLLHDKENVIRRR